MRVVDLGQGADNGDDSGIPAIEGPKTPALKVSSRNRTLKNNPALQVNLSGTLS